MTRSDIEFYLLILIRRLPLLASVVALGTAAGVGLALIVQPSYLATARILVENPTIPAQLARTTVTSTAAEQLLIIHEQFRTREHLLEMADRFGIYDDVSPAPRPEDIVTDMRSRIGFEQMVLDSEGSGTSIISISFQAEDPVLAATVANDLAASLLKASEEARTGRAGDTIRFFEKERVRLQQELADVEKAILDFKNANGDSLPDSLEFRRSRQVALQERLILLDREESALQSRRMNLGRLIGSADPGVPQTPERQMLNELNRAIAAQRSVFAEDSPTIRTLVERKRTLEAMLLSEPAGPGAGEGPAAIDPDTQISRAEIDARLESIAKEKQLISEELRGLSESLARTPASENALNELTRDRDNLQLQYNAAVAKLGEALVGERVEDRTVNERFSIVEHAVPPLRSTGPRRRMIALAGVLAGGVVGAGLILLMELLNGSIRRPEEVSALLQTPMLGVIPIIEPRPRRLVRIMPARLQPLFK